MRVPGPVLVVDDDTAVLHALGVTFRALGLECIGCASGDEALARAPAAQPAVAFVDLAMPGMNGIAVLRALHAHDASLPVIIMTAYSDLDSAVQAIHDGAYEYLTKPLDLQRLRVLTRRALEFRELTLAAKQAGTRPADGVPAPRRIVGRHPSMVEVFKAVGAASRPGNRSTVLILGETGTGKELVARAIHDRSPSRREPFLVVNCAGMTESLLESEIFGHEKGAFTGAVQRHIGKLEAAGAGTVFLDEVGDFSAAVQVKFLRLLETAEYERVGSTETRQVSARFVAATHRDLAAAKESGSFREDLFYRLSVITVRVPSLRERRDDIPLLVDHFLARFARPDLEQPMAVDRQAMEILLSHGFPGNVRELEHMIEQAITLARGPVILPEHLPGLRVAPDPQARMPIVSKRLEEARRYVVEAFEKDFVMDALRQAGGNVTVAAEAAGIHRQSFQRLMQRYGIVSQPFRSRP